MKIRRLAAVTLLAAAVTVAAVPAASASPSHQARPAGVWTGKRCSGSTALPVHWRICLTISGSGNLLKTARIDSNFRAPRNFFGFWNATVVAAVFESPLKYSFKPIVGPTVSRSGWSLATGNYTWVTHPYKRLRSGLQVCATIYQVLKGRGQARRTVCM